MTDDPAGTYYQAQAATVQTVVAELAKQWKLVAPADLDGSWAAVRAQVVLLIAAGQVRAAALPARVIARTLILDGLTAESGLAVTPAGFAGYTSAGYQMTSVVDVAPILVKKAIARGESLTDALLVGRNLLGAIASTEIGDASRDSMGIGMRLEPRIKGYVRRVEPHACHRCAVQDGKFFKDNTGFLRHPHCHCVHSPVTKSGTQEPIVVGQGMALSGSAFSPARKPDRTSVLRIARQSRSASEYADLLVQNGYAA